MKHFTLPADLLRMPLLSNTVDLDAFKRIKDTTTPLEDKDLLLPIEELERKFKSFPSSGSNNNISSSAINTTSSTNTTTVTPTNATMPVKKFARPDVTWLRRTEYISSVKTTSSAASTLSVDDAKALLADPVDFSQIVQAVNVTFDSAFEAPTHHPLKPSVTLLQSFPLTFASGMEDGYAHCLFLGDNACNENSILKVNSEHIVTLFNPVDESSIYKSYGDFDIQQSDSSARKASSSEKGLVLMLPMDMNADSSSKALLVKINSNFSLRKRRSAKGKGTSIRQVATRKILKIQRQQQ